MAAVEKVRRNCKVYEEDVEAESDSEPLSALFDSVYATELCLAVQPTLFDCTADGRTCQRLVRARQQSARDYFRDSMLRKANFL